MAWLNHLNVHSFGLASRWVWEKMLNLGKTHLVPQICFKPYRGWVLISSEEIPGCFIFGIAGLGGLQLLGKPEIYG